MAVLVAISQALAALTNTWLPPSVMAARAVSDNEGLFSEGKGVAEPPPPRCRKGVSSPYLPAYIFLVPGDPREIAP